PLLIAQLSWRVLRVAVPLDPALDRVRVGAEGRLEARLPVLVDRDRSDGHEDAHRDADPLLVRAEPDREPAAALRDEQHRNRRSDRIREGDEDGPRPDSVRARDRRDRAQYRARAGDEDEAEARAEQEAAAEIAAAAPGQEEERPLEQLAGLGHDERGGD